MLEANCLKGYYMKNFNSTDLCQNENALILRAQNHDVYARNLIIEMNLPLIQKIAKSIQSDVLSNSDLVQEGTLGLITAIEKFNVVPEETVMICDQLFTDVIGANRMGMLSIYVEPISKKEHWYTSWKRPIEAYFLKKW